MAAPLEYVRPDDSHVDADTPAVGSVCWPGDGVDRHPRDVAG
jgi:hypothetical protein